MNTCQCQRNDPNSLGFCTIFVVFAKVLAIAVCNRNTTYLKDDPECKPWHLNWTIHPRHVPLANTFCDYRNIFEVLYDNTNYTCHHRDCTSELRAYEFSTEGIWCLKWYLWDPLLIHESYLYCKKKLKVNH